MTTNHTASRLAPFGTTIFTEMTALAIKHSAVNLSQGFPDFDGPEFIRQAACRAINEGHNQYARMFGIPELTKAVAADWAARNQYAIDPDANVTVTSGCTEAIAATFLGLINPGDEVILFEPYYDSYRACISMAGARPRFVTLRPRRHAASGEMVADGFEFDEVELRAAFSSKTRAILLNTPHNPTGKVFTRNELDLIAVLCHEHDVIAITDQVYERLLYDDARHISIADLPGMFERTVTLSSLGKTFSLTGWKIGWAVAPPHLTRAVRSAHQFLTFATATPLQHAAAEALESSQAVEYVDRLAGDYERRRNFLAESLADIGYGVHVPAGAYFIFADHTPFSDKDDVAHCKRLIEHAGVAAIPPSVFYANQDEGRRFVRFAFCKKDETLEEAVERMQSLKERAA
ncbi:MAG: aminotransferase class I/II-fold pyridoxal phosphate-dependent enzyme [Planctomycetota bacterium]|nr:aminotransferase class I/II-fold pyridoxal phosphate-dependent enzyme [Planctomycetota bacterium]